MAKIAWLVPSILEGSGGHRTIFQNVQALINAGHDCDVYLNTEEDTSEKELAEKVFKFFGRNDANYHIGWAVPDDYDLAFATIMYSAKVLHDLPIKAKKAYFIQDYESWFNPMGDTYLIGENSYRMNLFPITIGKWLTHKMIGDFGSTSSFFDFGADLDVYMPIQNSLKEKAVCFIYQPEKPRRCAHLGIEALGILKHRMPDVKIYLYGSRAKGNVWFEHENLELLPIEKCNELYNKCQVGLCISSSNPSRIPFEMMASGLPVVDIHRENNLYDMPQNGVLLADQTPEAIAASLMHLLINSEIRNEMSSFAMNYMKDYSLQHGFDQFVKSVNDILENKFTNQTLPKALYNKKAFTVPSYNNYFVSGELNQFQLRYPAKDFSLPNEKLPTISLDIWDTILRRKCHPDETKINTARYFFFKYNRLINPWFINPFELFLFRQSVEKNIGQYYLDAGFDDEYLISEVFNEFLLKVILNPQMVDIQSITEELIDYELKIEGLYTYPDPDIKDFLIDKLDYNEKDPLVCISDFYMSEELLSKLFLKHDLHVKPTRIFSSADILLNKRGGRIFEKLKEENVISDHLIHIGDNVESDYNNPQKQGIRSLHYFNQKEEEKRDALNLMFSDRAWSFEKYGDYLSQLINESDKEIYSETYKLGRKYSPIFYGFILFIIEEAIKRGIDKIYYFTREGEFFKRIHDELVKHNPLNLELPKAELLHVSRLSTFCASLNEISTDELMRIWNMYSTQSMKALFKSLNADSSDFKVFTDAHDIDLEEMIQYPWQDNRVIALFNNNGFVEKLTEHRNFLQNQLVGYLNQKSVDVESSNPLFIVDIGWRGTIHDNLAHLMPNRKIVGAYLGQFKHLNNQPNNVEKLCFGPDERVDIPDVVSIIKHVAPLEMLCNSNGGSVKGFKYENGIYDSVRVNDSSEDKVFEEFTSDFQEGVIDTVELISSVISTHAIWSTELKSYSIVLMRELMKRPEKPITKAFFNLNHNEEFGTGVFADKSFKIPRKISNTTVINDKNSVEIINYLNQTSWPEGFLINENLNKLHACYLAWELASLQKEERINIGKIGKIKELVKKANVTLRDEGFVTVVKKTYNKIKNKL